MLFASLDNHPQRVPSKQDTPRSQLDIFWGGAIPILVKNLELLQGTLKRSERSRAFLEIVLRGFKQGAQNHDIPETMQGRDDGARHMLACLFVEDPKNGWFSFSFASN